MLTAEDARRWMNDASICDKNTFELLQAMDSEITQAAKDRKNKLTFLVRSMEMWDIAVKALLTRGYAVSSSYHSDSINNYWALYISWEEKQ